MPDKTLPRPTLKRAPARRGAVPLVAPVPSQNVVLLKAFFAAVDVLGLDVHDAAVLLATSEKSIRRYRADPNVANLNRDQVDRIIHVIAIYESLRDIFSGNPLAFAWLRRPNRNFGDRPPLDRMRAGSMRDLADVQRYLAANNGGVW